MIYLLVLDVLDCIDDVPDSYCTFLLVLYILTRTAHIFIREFWKKGIKLGRVTEKGDNFDTWSHYILKALGQAYISITCWEWTRWAWKSVNDPVVSFVLYGNKKKYLWPLPTTLKNRQRLAVIQFGVKSSNLNEDFERLLTTMNDFQQRWKTANDCNWFPKTQKLQWPR